MKHCVLWFQLGHVIYIEPRCFSDIVSRLLAQASGPSEEERCGNLCILVLCVPPVPDRETLNVLKLLYRHISFFIDLSPGCPLQGLPGFDKPAYEAVVLLMQLLT